MSATETSTHPEAFVLLHIPEVVLHSAGATEQGTLALECVALAPNNDDKTAPLAASLSADDRSLYLVLRLNSLELPLDPTRSISVHVANDGARTYTFQATDVSPVEGPTPVYLTVPIPSRPDSHRAETIEAFDHILAQYAEVEGFPPSPVSPAQRDGAASSSSQVQAPGKEDMRGKLVLMDEESGEVVGELPHRVHMKEDPALARAEKGKDGAPAPVLLELPPDVYDAYTGQGASVLPYHTTPQSDVEEAREIFVQAIPPEDQDWMTKSATIISQAITSSTSMLLSGLTSAASYYINHSTPSPHASGSQTPGSGPPPPPPRALLLLSHPRTHSALSSAYAVSGQAVRVSQKTVSVVESMIRHAVGGKDKAKAAPTLRRPQPPTTSTVPPSASPNPTPAMSSLSLSEPPPPYPGTQDGKPPLPPRHGPPPPLPPRSPLPAGEKSASSASVPTAPSATPAGGPPPRPLRKHEKLVLSANLLLATVDDSVKRAVDVGSTQLTAVMGHKYGEGAGRTTHLATHTARNVTLVYIDMRGFARRALIKKAGKEWIKARVGGRRQQAQMDGVVVDRPAVDEK
ncbi:uncharacterized protein TRAVEDRAFT_146573 [Trametes versicolor FP-101664 SS1]|uniref:uncharacterized protein n=1 Tax=Trametes versicolor (strain FP-101664) TaxID=717944 RepID=UPI0004621650|nr:uncharacterized protein TRAVEDRAFT_146573 [Trametes versicolor FP-101664 SS1]EIW60897.1 hypothetical protein TRAVEDRAFT_146573 [Trametes versicolor FP-101664 SS1]